MTSHRSPAAPRADVAVDVVCAGESMVTFRPTVPGRLADVPAFERGIGGAESNVACTLAAAGHRTRWVGRVGADGFGEHLVAAVAAYGVDTTGVVRDAGRPTGIYFRTAGERATGPAAGGGVPGEPLAEVAYYRAGSAASAMSPANMDRDTLFSGRVLHLSGITAALSADCLALLHALSAPAADRPLLSFDVNYRANLWRSPAGPVEPAEPAATTPPAATDGPRALLALARRADLVFVGEDEAEAAWGLTGGPDAIRAALPEPAVLVVKQGADGATAYEDGSSDGVHEPAPRVDVTASVGAGDAFAAGFLSATLRGLPLRERLRHGHLTAAATLTTPHDLAPPPARADADRMVALEAADWAALHLTPDTFRSVPQGRTS